MRNEKDEGSLGRVAYWDDSTQSSLVFSLLLASRRVLFRSVLITIRLEQVMSKASSELFEMWCILSSVLERTKMLPVLLWRWDDRKKTKTKKNREPSDQVGACYLRYNIRVHSTSQQYQNDVYSIFLGSNVQRSKSILWNSEKIATN